MEQLTETVRLQLPEVLTADVFLEMRSLLSRFHSIPFLLEPIGAKIILEGQSLLFSSYSMLVTTLRAMHRSWNLMDHSCSERVH
jgi:hypothetical protein